MNRWKDDGDYWTIKLDNKMKKRVTGSISIKKTALNAPKYYSTKQGKTAPKTGA